MREGPDFPDRNGTTTTRTTTEREVVVAPPSPSAEPQPPVVLVGRLVSVRYVLGALRRRRKVWLTLAALGLLVGLGYHVVVPRSYSAYATLYLAQPPGIDPAVGMANDLALLQTTAVGQRAAALLGEHSVSPASLLGKVPGIVQSEDVLQLNASGPTKSEAVRRANALATAFLAFRAERIRQQTTAADAALNKQINFLRQQISQLSATISGLGSSPAGTELTDLVSEQSSDTSSLTSLQQSVQQNVLASIAVDSGSRVVTPGTLVPASTTKLFGLGALSGLIGGLVIGVGYVAVQAVVSDRIRRRDEVASLLGAPVELSLKPVRHPKKRPEAWIRQSALEPGEQVAALSGYLRLRGVPQGERTTLLVVALDDLTVPAASMAGLAKRLADEGESVLVADLTVDGVLAQGLQDLPVGHHASRAGSPGGNLQVFRPSSDEMSEAARSPWVAAQADAQAVLALTTIDLAKGAWHLSWAKEAVVSVTAGRSSAKRVTSTAVLLRAAGMTIRSGVLLGADAEDESIGLLQPEAPLVGLPVADGVIRS